MHAVFFSKFRTTELHTWCVTSLITAQGGRLTNSSKQGWLSFPPEAYNNWYEVVRLVPKELSHISCYQPKG